MGWHGSTSKYGHKRTLYKKKMVFQSIAVRRPLACCVQNPHTVEQQQISRREFPLWLSCVTMLCLEYLVSDLVLPSIYEDMNEWTFQLEISPSLPRGFTNEIRAIKKESLLPNEDMIWRIYKSTQRYLNWSFSAVWRKLYLISFSQFLFIGPFQLF